MDPGADPEPRSISKLQEISLRENPITTPPEGFELEVKTLSACEPNRDLNLSYGLLLTAATCKSREWAVRGYKHSDPNTNPNGMQVDTKIGVLVNTWRRHWVVSRLPGLQVVNHSRLEPSEQKWAEVLE